MILSMICSLSAIPIGIRGLYEVGVFLRLLIADRIFGLNDIENNIVHNVYEMEAARALTHSFAHVALLEFVYVAANKMACVILILQTPACLHRNSHDVNFQISDDAVFFAIVEKHAHLMETVVERAKCLDLVAASVHQHVADIFVVQVFSAIMLNCACMLRPFVYFRLCVVVRTAVVVVLCCDPVDFVVQQAAKLSFFQQVKLCLVCAAHSFQEKLSDVFPLRRNVCLFCNSAFFVVICYSLDEL